MSEKKSFVSRARYKKPQRIAFVVIIVLISVGLVLPSMIGVIAGMLATDNDPITTDYLAPGERIAKFEETIKAHPEDAQAWAGLAEAYYANNQLDQAILKYNQALELEPANSDWRTALALVCFMDGRYDEAVGQIEEELSRHPDNSLAYYYYGQFLAYGKNDYAGAITQMEKYVELVGSGPDAAKAMQMVEEWKKQV
jgi:cytochrome c-type biogenesis protein CcmH/NrfG